MSFVGPRSQTRSHYDLYSDEQRAIISKLIPGVTGVGSLFFRNEDAILKSSGKPYKYFHHDVITPYKGELELWYAEHRTTWLYLKIIYLTAVTIVNRHYNVLQHFPGLPIPSTELLSALPSYYQAHFDN